MKQISPESFYKYLFKVTRSDASSNGKNRRDPRIIFSNEITSKFQVGKAVAGYIFTMNRPFKSDYHFKLFSNEHEKLRKVFFSGPELVFRISCGYDLERMLKLSEPYIVEQK